MKSFIIVGLVSVFGYSTLQGVINDQENTAKNDTILWDASGKLKWEDFQGVPVKNDLYKARTYSTIGYDATVLTDKIEVNLVCEFEKNKSWTTSKTLDLLRHEQLHFDIAELISRKIRKQYEKHISIEVSKTNKILKSIYTSHVDSIWLLKNRQYDKETAHGTILAKQKEWELKIAKELKALEAYSSTRVIIEKSK